MKINLIETDTQIKFVVPEQEEASAEVLKGMFYEFQDGVFQKSFPKAALMFDHDLSQLEANFRAHIADLHNPDKMTLQDLEAAFDWIAGQFAENGIRWWLTGSGALYVRGIPIKPHDLDIMTFKSETEKILAIVSPYIAEPFHHITDWVLKGFGVVYYRYQLDIAFEPEAWVDGRGPADFGPYAQTHLEKVCWRGHEILVPPVELHLAPNKARGRLDRVKLIEDYMARRQGRSILTD